ncbi:MAG: hypothetical protein GF393_10835 [Armatimonadia bacterium]|nr:hypothetical protein [Armatimonadia bacterium]
MGHAGSPEAHLAQADHARRSGRIALPIEGGHELLRVHSVYCWCSQVVVQTDFLMSEAADSVEHDRCRLVYETQNRSRMVVIDGAAEAAPEGLLAQRGIRPAPPVWFGTRTGACPEIKDCGDRRLLCLHPEARSSFPMGVDLPGHLLQMYDVGRQVCSASALACCLDFLHETILERGNLRYDERAGIVRIVTRTDHLWRVPDAVGRACWIDRMMLTTIRHVHKLDIQGDFADHNYIFDPAFDEEERSICFWMPEYGSTRTVRICVDEVNAEFRTLPIALTAGNDG